MFFVWASAQLLNLCAVNLIPPPSLNTRARFGGGIATNVTSNVTKAADFAKDQVETHTKNIASTTGDLAGGFIGVKKVTNSRASFFSHQTAETFPTATRP